jgi:hypothetical protein
MVEAERQSQIPRKPPTAAWTWADILDELKGKVPKHHESFLRQLTLVSVADDVITLGSRFEHTRDVIIERHLGVLHESIQKVSGGMVKRVSFVTDESFPYYEDEADDAAEPSSVEQPPASPKPSSAEAFAKMTAIDPLNLAPCSGETTLVAIPMVRHWLFAPDKTKRHTRSFNVKTKHKGKRVMQTVRVGDFNAAPNKGYGVLTTRHQKALFAIQEIWQEQRGQMVALGSSHHGFVATTSWQLEERIFGSHGGRQSAMVRQLLQELASIPVAITNYIDADDTLCDIDMTGLLCGVNFKKGAKTQKGGVWVEILLGELLTRAFQLSSIKPLALKVINGLAGDVAPLLYPKFDYMLYRCDELTFKLPTLVNTLGLMGEIQRKPSKQRTLFQKAAHELTGRPLSKPGRTLRVRVAHGEAADGGDYLIASSVPQ